MRIGIFSGTSITNEGTVDAVVAEVRAAHEQGFPSYWVPQIFGYDALTLLALVGSQVPDIELGTAVIPTYPRHPMMLAAQALTVQSATGGRLALGIGLSHQIVIEAMFGYSFAKPVRHMKEHLSILRPLLHGEPVSFQGETLSANGAITIPGSTPPPILVAALGTQMLQLTARLADGTITWMTGAQTIAEHTVPTITSAAKEAGRNETMRVCVSLPVCVTADPDSVRERAARELSIYGQLPSYRAMLDREGLAGPADIVVAGDEKEVEAGIARVRDAGATDFIAAEVPASDDERRRTRDLLCSLL